jgi:hypothetical protein
MEEEVVVPFRAAKEHVEPVGRVRSTLIGASIQALRRRGHEPEYGALLPNHVRRPLFDAVPGTWLPIGLAIAHYEAVERLDLAPSQRLELASEVAQQVQGSLVLTLGRGGAGPTPWTVLAQAQRLWDRLLDGGAIGVTKVNTKEARIEALGLPLARIPYVRLALRGFVSASCEPFAKRVHVTELSKLCSDRALGYRVVWA